MLRISETEPFRVKGFLTNARKLQKCVRIRILPKVSRRTSRIFNRRLFLKVEMEHFFELKFIRCLQENFDEKEGDLFFSISLDNRGIEPFVLTDEPQVFVGIHSPYVPIDVDDLNAIIPGREYRIDVQLEKEEHLLPPPYQTDCAENGPSEDAKASTNPNSFQVTPSQVAVLKQNVVHTLFQG
ncbi:hypothetical protein AVEN_99993-1 [Araneus ventricosus]|uniref:Uncharacterized protein n=1 Tax=Araneus ventricosus TaxID=182803 RepID=A0A4Y2JU17_ARAVE|nr:hypothetical protein AVEN_99993-1 [Araneus ventricosus]